MPSIEHETEKNEMIGEAYNWLPDFVYGGIDGAVTTFAVVAGVEGADLSAGVILVLGFANLFADGFSMATGKYLSDKAELEQYEKVRAMEMRHLTQYRNDEIEEIQEILSEYGFKGKDLKRATEIITANEEGWVDLMMKHEFSLNPDLNPISGGLSTLISFIVIGFIPLAAYTFKPILNLSGNTTFIATSIATLGAMFIIGAVKSKFTSKHWFWSGLEVVFLGGIAASIAYAIGVLLKGLA